MKDRGKSDRGKTLVRGHTLRHEGAAFKPNGYLSIYDQTHGHAKCSCGALSESLPSRNARKRWHRAHKEEVRDNV